MTAKAGATVATSRALNTSSISSSNGDLPIQGTFTAVVLKYVLDFQFGILRTQVNGNGLFSIAAVAYCYKHKLNCKDSDCPDYKKFNPRDKGYSLGDILPLGTQVNVTAIPFKLDTDQIRFHASLVWPHMSKKPANVCELDDADMNDIVASYLTWGDGDRPTTNSSSSAKPPGFAMAPGAQLKPAFSKSNGKDITAQMGPIVANRFNGDLNNGTGIASNTFFNEHGNAIEVGPVVTQVGGLFPDHAAVWKPMSDQGGSFLANSNGGGKDDPKHLDNFLAKLQSLIDFCQKDCGMTMNKREMIRLSNDILKIANPDMEQAAISQLLNFMKTHNFAQNEREQGIIVAKFKVRFHSLCSGTAAAAKATQDLASGDRMVLNKKLKDLKESKQQQVQSGSATVPSMNGANSSSSSIDTAATSELNKILERMKVNESGAGGSAVPESWTERHTDSEDGGAAAATASLLPPAMASAASISPVSSETSSLSGAPSASATSQSSLFPAKFNPVHNLKQFKSLVSVGHHDKAVKNLNVSKDKLMVFSALETWLEDFLSRVKTPFGNVNLSVMSRALVYSWSEGTGKISD